MIIQQNSLKTMHITLWVAQIVLAAFLIMGAIMKFMPIEKISAMMPWTGQIPVLLVRVLDIIDLLGALGLILPSWLRIKPQLTPWSALLDFTKRILLSVTLSEISSYIGIPSRSKYLL